MNHAAIILRLIGRDVGGFFVFPAWWYTKGLRWFGSFCKDLFSKGAARLGVGVWVKNLFVPMFGQHDWVGRLISLLVRLGQIVIRSVLSAAWLVVCALLIVAWVIVPPIALIGIIFEIQAMLHA